MDYYGFQPDLYDVKFKSRGSAEFSQEILQTLQNAGVPARLTPVEEPRGKDGKGRFSAGFDHGVFVPFIHMFGPEFTEIPIVQVSMHSSLEFDDEYRLGQAVAALRYLSRIALSAFRR